MCPIDGVVQLQRVFLAIRTSEQRDKQPVLVLAVDGCGIAHVLPPLCSGICGERTEHAFPNSIPHVYRLTCIIWICSGGTSPPEGPRLRQAVLLYTKNRCLYHSIGLLCCQCFFNFLFTLYLFHMKICFTRPGSDQTCRRGIETRHRRLPRPSGIQRRDCGCIPDAAPPRSGIRWAAASPEATFPSMSRASGAAEAGEHPAGSLRRPSRQTGGHAGAYGVFRVSARSALRSLPRMAHEDTRIKKGKRHTDVPFKRPVAWKPLDADP